MRACVGAYRVYIPLLPILCKIRLTSLSFSSPPLSLSLARIHIYTYIFNTRRFEVRGGEVTGQLRAKLNVYRQSGDTLYYLFFVFSALPDRSVDAVLSPPFPFSCPTVFQRVGKVPYHTSFSTPSYFLAGRDLVLLAGRYAYLCPSRFFRYRRWRRIFFLSSI